MDNTTVKSQAERGIQVFAAIHRDQMAGLPLVNEALSVATVGFQVYEGRVLGILITPWIMSLVLFPGVDDRWEPMALGDKQSHLFSGGTCRFLVNHIQGLGVCQMHSMYSPMRAFPDQSSALTAAETFLDRLLTPQAADAAPQGTVEEKLLGRILRGETVPELDDL